MAIVIFFISYVIYDAIKVEVRIVAYNYME